MAIIYHHKDGTTTNDGSGGHVDLHIYTYDEEEEKEDLFLKTVEELESLGIYGNTKDENFKETDVKLTEIPAEGIPTDDESTFAPAGTLIGEIQRKNKLIKDRNNIELIKTKANLESMKINVAFKLFEARSREESSKLQARSMNIQNTANQIKLESNQIKKESNDIRTSIKESTDNLVTATEEQQMTADFSASTISMNMGDFTTFNSKLTTATEKISESIEVQKEHFEFIKNGSPDLKDSKGNIIKPREIKALKDAENYLSQKIDNDTDYASLMADFLESDSVESNLSESNILEETLNLFLDVDIDTIDNAYKEQK
jgi:hypothetical protein